LLRFGVIGLGRACTSFLPALLKHPGVTITAGADPRPEARAKWAADYGADVFESGDDLCASPNVDAVYIATPHTLHAPNAISAARNGKHIIVEKPMALTLEDCDAVIDAAARAGIKLVVGHSQAYAPPIYAMRDIIASGELGRLRLINAFNYKSFMYIPLRRDELDLATGGGVVFNQGSHHIDIVRWLGGGLVRSVRANTWQFDPERPVEGAYSAFLEFEDGAVAMLVFSGYDHFDSDEWYGWVGEGGQPKDGSRYSRARTQLLAMSRVEEEELKAATGVGGAQQRDTQPGGVQQFQPHFGVLIASCERGDIRTTPDGLVVYGDDVKREIPVPVPAAGKIRTVEELYDAVDQDREPDHNGRWGKAGLEVALAIHQSARERREIALQYQVAHGH
jgi:phthalate 4,5-cis-dihydrodiol dehydrogenase